MNMILHNNRISLRLAEKILKQARQRRKELIKNRNKPVSLSSYLRELIKLDSEKKLIN
jgi:hypothetical protein